MKKTKIAMIFVIAITALIMQLSCATAEKEKDYGESQTVSDQVQEAKEMPAVAPSAPEVTPIEALFLADTHNAAGVECSDCHEESPPANDVATATCLTCHEDYRDVALSSIDPHNAHIEYSNCGDCHHGHRESENQCMSCHSFSLKAP